MSQPDTDRTSTDRRAAQAVVRHHAELAATLGRHVAALFEAAEIGSSRLTWQHRDELVAWIHGELLPHAAAEEAALYPAAAAQPDGRLLVDGMVAEHKAITALVGDLEAAGTPTTAAAAARALSALFEVHLAKENDLVLPLLLAADQVSLHDLLEGMHDMLGSDETRAGGCGGDGACGCGGDAGRADAPAPVLSLDARLDVRGLPHDQRHARVLAALAALPADGGLVLIAPHAPRPLLAEIDARYPGQIGVEWLQEGPDVWQIRLHRQAATV
jgi:uncharacterized protein (DUF2249 family)